MLRRPWSCLLILDQELAIETEQPALSQDYHGERAIRYSCSPITNRGTTMKMELTLK